MRVAFLGNAPWSVPSLVALSGSSHDLAVVATRAPRPAGRGKRPAPTAVAEAARTLGLPLREVDTVKSGPDLEAFRASAPDVLAVVAYGEILPADVLGVPRIAPVNVHFSLLPALRGANPVARAILEGIELTGVTTMRMDEGMDTGPVLLQQTERIREEDDTGSLGARLAELGGALLVETLDRMERGEVQEHPQEDARATMAPRFRPHEEWIDWSSGGDAVWRQVRALSPEPGARTRFRGKVLKVMRARPTDGSGAPGEIVEVPHGHLVVAAGGGAVALEEVVPEGRRRMSGAEFARGHRPEPGERMEEAPS